MAGLGTSIRIANAYVQLDVVGQRRMEALLGRAAKAVGKSAQQMRRLGLGALAFGSAALVAFGKTVQGASDLTEQTNKAVEVFGGSTQKILDWSKTTAGSFGIANEEDVEQVEYLPGQTKSIRDRVKDLALKGATGILGLINPALGFFARGLKGIGSLNDRIQQSDFGRSKTLKEFLDKRRARKAAEEAAARDAMRASVRNLQSRIDRGDFGGGEGGGGGGFQGHGGYGTSAERGAALHG